MKLRSIYIHKDVLESWITRGSLVDQSSRSNNKDFIHFREVKKTKKRAPKKLMPVMPMLGE